MSGSRALARARHAGEPRRLGSCALAAARRAVEAELAAIDLACSRFRADSSLSRLNAGAGRPVRVGPLLFEAIAVALRAAALTDGIVDPTIGRGADPRRLRPRLRG